MSNQRGFSLIELLIVVAIIGIIAAIAIPNFTQSRIAANEASAIAIVRTICTAQITYASTHDGVYTSLGVLAAAPVSLLDTNIAYRNGYDFVSTGADGTFTITATPRAGQGVRNFYCDQTGVIRVGGAGGAPIGTASGGGGS